MRHIKEYWIILGVVMPLIISCEVAELTKFETAPAVYFHRQPNANWVLYQNDSIGFTFFVKDDDSMEESVYLIVNALGPISDTPRKLTLVQTNVGGVDAAVAGTHFVPFDTPEVASEMVMPAGKVQTTIPIKVKRHESMKTKEIRLELAIIENEYFKIHIPSQSKFLVKMTSMASRPSSWGTWEPYFGPWGSKKMWFIIQYVGFSDFENPQLYDSDVKTYYKFSANTELEKYNKKMGTDLMEDDGLTKVEFPK